MQCKGRAKPVPAKHLKRFPLPNFLLVKLWVELREVRLLDHESGSVTYLVTSESHL